MPTLPPKDPIDPDPREVAEQCSGGRRSSADVFSVLAACGLIFPAEGYRALTTTALWAAGVIHDGPYTGARYPAPRTDRDLIREATALSRTYGDAVPSAELATSDAEALLHIVMDDVISWFAGGRECLPRFLANLAAQVSSHDRAASNLPA